MGGGGGGGRKCAQLNDVNIEKILVRILAYMRKFAYICSIENESILT